MRVCDSCLYTLHGLFICRHRLFRDVLISVPVRDWYLPSVWVLVLPCWLQSCVFMCGLLDCRCWQFRDVWISVPVRDWHLPSVGVLVLPCWLQSRVFMCGLLDCRRWQFRDVWISVPVRDWHLPSVGVLAVSSWLQSTTPSSSRWQVTAMYKSLIQPIFNPVLLLKGWKSPVCVACNSLLTVEHILINCVDLDSIHQYFYTASNLVLNELFVLYTPLVLLIN